MKNIDDFVSKLVEEKGFDEKDPLVIEQIKSDLLERIEDRVNAMIVRNLKVEDLDEFEKALDQNDEQALESFVQMHIPDINEKVAAELLAFRSVYLG